MANVPATFPVLPVNGYMISGMLTRGKNCEDGILCAPKLSEVEGGDAVYPVTMKAELLKNVGDFYIDCERMPSAADLSGHETEVIDAGLKKVQLIRDQQTQLFDYLLTNHPTDFTWLVQSCEDRTGHWLYPIAPYNVGYNPKVNSARTDAFPNQYIAFDKVLGTILKHADDNTYAFIVSDHGIKPLREFEEIDPHGECFGGEIMDAMREAGEALGAHHLEVLLVRTVLVRAMESLGEAYPAEVLQDYENRMQVSKAFEYLNEAIALTTRIETPLQAITSVQS